MPRSVCVDNATRLLSFCAYVLVTLSPFLDLPNRSGIRAFRPLVNHRYERPHPYRTTDCWLGLVTMNGDGRTITFRRSMDNGNSSTTAKRARMWQGRRAPKTGTSDDTLTPTMLLRSINCAFMLAINVCLYISVVCFFSSSSSIVNSRIDNSWLNEVSILLVVCNVLASPQFRTIVPVDLCAKLLQRQRCWWKQKCSP